MNLDNILLRATKERWAIPHFNFATDEQLKAIIEACRELNSPVMVGVSRKSMIGKLLGCTPDEALNGTVVLNTVALMKGIDILRVHDVKEAVEAIKIIEKLKQFSE